MDLHLCKTDQTLARVENAGEADQPALPPLT